MSLPHAGIARRLAAWCIDGVALTITAGLTGFAAIGIFVQAKQIDVADGMSTAMSFAIMAIFLLVTLVVGWLYSAILESSSRQGTLGKMALGIAAADTSGNRLSFGRATGRFFAKLLSGVTLFLGYLIAFASPERRTLHDLLAGTMVVKRSAVAAQASTVDDVPVAATNQRSASYPGIKQALVLLGLVLFIAVAVAVPVGIICEVIDFPFFEHPASMALINTAAFGLAFWCGVRRVGRPFSQVCSVSGVPASLFAPIGLVIVGASIVISELDNLFRMILPMPDWVLEIMRDMVMGEPLWGNILAVVIVAPLTEEFLFRGLILSGFMQRYSVRKAVVASTLLFAAIHLNPWQMPGALIAGLLLGWWTIATGSLVPALFGHALFNACPIIAIALGIEIAGYSTDPAGPLQMQPWWLDLTGLILAAVGIVALRRMLRRRDGEFPLGSSREEASAC